MRIALIVNGGPVVKASLESRGWLNAHVNLSSGIDAESQDSVWLGATDISEEPNSTHSKWAAVPRSIGDTIEIKILEDGESDPPTSLTKTSDSQKNLFSNVQQARSLLSAIRTCDAQLMDVIEKARGDEPADEFKKIARAVAGILAEIDRQLISPTLNRHPELLAEAREKGLR